MFVASLVGVGALRTAASAQSSAPLPRIAILVNDPGSPHTTALRNGLTRLGYVDGRNVVIDFRSFEGDFTRLPALAAELVALKPSVLAVIGAVEVKAVLQQTRTIPVVFAVAPDAVAAGLVSNAEHPGGNVTGFTAFDPRQAGKQLQLLKTIIPAMKNIAILGDAAVSPALFVVNEEAAHALGLQPQLLKLQGSPPDLIGAFNAATAAKADALVVLQHPSTRIHRREIGDLVVSHRLPSLWPVDFVDSGWRGLVGYGTSLADAAGQIPSYIDKILKGAKPGDLPVQAAAHSTLIVNLVSARELGITIPPEALSQAETVVR